MGIILPDNVTPSQYNDWRKNSAAGRRYSQGIESQANKGYSVSHAPPGEEITSWLNQRNPAGPAPHSPQRGQDMSAYRPRPKSKVIDYWSNPQRGQDMSAYRPQTSSAQKSSAPDMSTYKPNPYVSEGQFRNMFSGGQAQPRQQSFGTPYGWRERPSGSPTTNPAPESMGTPSRPPSRQPMGDAMLPPGWSFGPNGERIPPGARPAPEPQAQPEEKSPGDIWQSIRERFPNPIRMFSSQSSESQPRPQSSPINVPSPRPISYEFNQPGFQSFTTPSMTFGPPPVQPSFQAAYKNIDGSLSSQPNYATRDAFIQNINDAILPYQMGQRSGIPQFDIPGLMSAANNMVANGYQNPLAGLFG